MRRNGALHSFWNMHVPAWHVFCSRRNLSAGLGDVQRLRHLYWNGNMFGVVKKAVTQAESISVAGNRMRKKANGL